MSVPVAGAPIQIDFVSSWYDRLRKLLYRQFADAVTWDGWVRLLARQAQDLENSAQTMFSTWDITNSAGVNLDLDGRVVGQPRTVADDPTYRLFLGVRIAANKSAGTSENLYSVMRALLGASTAMVYVAGGIKQFVLRIATPITATQAAAAVSFLGVAKEAGARGLLEYQQSPTASLFVFSGGAGQGFSQGAFACVRQA